MSVLDQWTRLVDRALDVVLVKYPARTGLGVALGCTLSFLAHLLEPLLRNASFVNFAGVQWWGWLAPGILIMHIPTIASLFKQKSVGNDQVDLVLELIARGDFTREERRQHHRRLINHVVDEALVKRRETPRGIDSNIVELIPIGNEPP